MRMIEFNDHHNILKYEIYLNGTKYTKKEQGYASEGREYEWDWHETPMCGQMITHFDETYQST